MAAASGEGALSLVLILTALFALSYVIYIACIPHAKSISFEWLVDRKSYRKKKFVHTCRVREIKLNRDIAAYHTGKHDTNHIERRKQASELNKRIRLYNLYVESHRDIWEEEEKELPIVVRLPYITF